MSSMYSMFKTDTQLETSGIVLDYGEFRVTIARAGGANKKFAKILEAKTRPYRRAIETETMDTKRATALLQEVYAEAVVLKWEVQRPGKDGEPTWEVGIDAPDGSVKPFNVANVLGVFQDLPDLFADIQAQAQKVAVFRADAVEAAAGN